jgi:uncharacterized protein
MIAEHYCYSHKSNNYLLNINKMKAYRIPKELYYKLLELDSEKLNLDEKILTALKKMELVNSEESCSDSFFGEFKDDIVTHICLNVAQRCNLECIYCYGNEGEYGKSGFMSEEIAFKAIDWLVKKSGESKKILVTFFGGEPLLNFPLIKKVVIYANEMASINKKRIYFSITTNGTLLNEEICEYFNKHKFSVVISIDGNVEVQNLNRPFKRNSYGHKSTIEKVEKFLKGRSGEALGRATITKYNSDLFSVYDSLKKIGFNRIEMANAYHNECITNGNISNNILESKQYVDNSELDYLEKLGEITSDGINNGNRVYQRNIIGVIERLAYGNKKQFFCGVGKGLVGISIDGDIFPCHRFMGKQGAKLGNVSDDFNRNNYYKISDTKILTERCATCWARYFCGGGCLFDNLDPNSLNISPNKHWCITMKKTVEIGIAVYDSLDKTKLKMFLDMNKEKYIESFSK